MEGFRIIFSAGLGLLLVGCGHAPPAPYPVWSARRLQRPPTSSSPNAFDAYALAALDVEGHAAKYLDRVYFAPKQREVATALMANGAALLEKGVHRRCEFRFEPTPPFEAAPYRRGWRLLGAGLVWQVQNAVALEDYPKAVKAAITATKFGFDLCGGGAGDASLGLSIADDARRAIAPAIGRMQTTQLRALAEGLENALHGKPPLTAAIESEGRTMLAAVQYVQDSYRIGDYSELGKNLGSDIHNAIDYLREMHANDGAERVAYFRGFANEADEEVRRLDAQASRFASDRRPATAKPQEKRPWWRFARHFFLTARPLLGWNDATVDRTSLLIIEASIQRVVRSGLPAPRTLGDFPTWLTTDAYTGKAFVYRSDGPDFDVYSVGQDLRDDGGETDETFTVPDLRCESGLR